MVESVADAPALQTPSDDEEDGDGDGDGFEDGDALDGSEGSPSRVGSDDDGSDLISVDERFSPVTPGGGAGARILPSRARRPPPPPAASSWETCTRSSPRSGRRARVSC